MTHFYLWLIKKLSISNMLEGVLLYDQNSLSLSAYIYNIYIYRQLIFLEYYIENDWPGFRI